MIADTPRDSVTAQTTCWAPPPAAEVAVLGLEVLGRLVDVGGREEEPIEGMGILFEEEQEGGIEG